MNIFIKTKSYLKRYGALNLIRKVTEKASRGFDISEEFACENLTDEELLKQRNYKFLHNPVISIVMPVYNPDDRYFKQTLNSIKNQTYENWQLCIGDAGNNKKNKILEEIFGNDDRVKYLDIPVNYGISGNSNKALELATGEYIGLMDHDDILTSDALFMIVSKLNEGYDIVYTDEDKTDENLNRYFSAYRKPDFNLNLFLSNNYMCHFTVISKKIIEEAGNFRSEYDGAQDYDLFLRCIEKTDRIGHVNKVLYHWRTVGGSTSGNPFNKEYAFDAGKRALQDYILRNNIKGVKVAQMEDPGYYRIRCGRKGKLSLSMVVDGAITNEGSDYYLVLDENMKISSSDVDKMLKRAYFTGADIVVPKIIRNGRYEYNGRAYTGNGYTPSLKGKRAWYKGQSNLGILNMDVNIVPVKGILIRKKLYDKYMNYKGRYICNLKGSFKGVKMVYAPESVISK